MKRSDHDERRARILKRVAEALERGTPQ